MSTSSSETRRASVASSCVPLAAARVSSIAVVIRRASPRAVCASLIRLAWFVSALRGGGSPGRKIRTWWVCGAPRPAHHLGAEAHDAGLEAEREPVLDVGACGDETERARDDARAEVGAGGFVGERLFRGRADATGAVGGELGEGGRDLLDDLVVVFERGRLGEFKRFTSGDEVGLEL